MLIERDYKNVGRKRLPEKKQTISIVIDYDIWVLLKDIGNKSRYINDLLKNELKKGG